MADALEQKFSNGHTTCIILTLHRLGGTSFTSYED